MANADWNAGSPAGSAGITYDAAATSYRGSLYTQSGGVWSPGATAANNILQSAKVQLPNYYPEQYIPELKENLRDNTILTRITNRDFNGKFRNKGDTIVIRHTPKVHSQRYIEGAGVVYEDPETDSENHTIKKARFWGFKIRDIRKFLSDIQNQGATWTKDGAADIAEGREVEFFADMPGLIAGAAINSTTGGAVPQNMGVAAGKRSGGYNLGSATHPVAVYNTDAATRRSTETVGTSTGNVSAVRTIIDLIADCESTLAEQPGGMKGRPFIVLPTILFNKIRTSELRAASVAGDSTSMLRKDIDAVDSICGFDIFRTNLLAKNSANAFPIIFGDTSAVTFADEISETEMLRAEGDFVTLHRSLCVYDWFLRWPERIGLAYMKVGA